MKSMALPREIQNIENLPVADEDVIELSEEELLALIDTGAREGLGMSGEEYLQRLREGRIERTGPNGYLAHLSMLASLLD
jgi:hypothetical protein